MTVEGKKDVDLLVIGAGSGRYQYSRLLAAFLLILT